MFYRLKSWLGRVFAGCYGVDQLSLTILYLDVALCIVGLFARSGWITLLSYVPMFFVLFRMLSKNRYQRYQENRRFLQLKDRLKDRSNRYYRCPKCRQMVRVPKGKGKISITCPRCKERFIRKT